MVKIAPSILAADFSRFGDEIRKAESAGADMIHLDIMDGHFVPNISFGVDMARMSESITDLPHDAHLMVTEPEQYLEDFIRAGVDYITFHIEIDGIRVDLGQGRWVYTAEEIPNPQRIINIISRVKRAGRKAGLTLNPPTEFGLITPFLDKIDLVLLMSVNPGFAGQRFIPGVFGKVRKAVDFRRNHGLDFEIMVDGGVGPDNAKPLIDMGVDILVSGSSFFNSEDFQEKLRELKS
jgi:ribulose-phosphate 3-epimerase